VLLSQISEFRSQHAVIDDEARKRVCRVEEQNLQQDRALGILQRELSDVRAAHTRLAAESASLGETTNALDHSLCLLQKEIAALSAQFAQENRALREELANSDNSRERENAALRKQQDGLDAQFEQEVAGLREQLTEYIAKVRQQQTNLAKPSTAPSPPAPKATNPAEAPSQVSVEPALPP
jgi:phage host-nuclease inhibitor protein Gam